MSAELHDNANTTDAVEHFTARAEIYDRSSKWCSDPELMRQVLELAAPAPDEHMLDVACGTGLVARAFRGHVARVVGVDPTAAMAERAADRLDEFVHGSAEELPFRDGEFDLVVCRQGLQFMDPPQAVQQMMRVTRPGGRIVLINLCAYGEEDRAEYFEILRLRNPARRSFFMAGDLANLLVRAGCAEVQLRRFITDEDVNVWADNGAISASNRGQIGELYRNASEPFRRLHQLRFGKGGLVIDHMLFIIAVGRKPEAS